LSAWLYLFKGKDVKDTNVPRFHRNAHGGTLGRRTELETPSAAEKPQAKGRTVEECQGTHRPLGKAPWKKKNGG
jgi:hypothetical protein